MSSVRSRSSVASLEPATSTFDPEMISRAARAAGAWLERERYRGYDPYDVLKSPILRIPGVRDVPKLRFVAQQVFRRIPVNIRPVLGIRRGVNPVTLGLAAQGWAYLAASAGGAGGAEAARARACVEALDALQTTGWSGACWGYDFDWQARYAAIPAFFPTVVATGFIAHGLFEVDRLVGDEQARRLCRSAAEFVVHDLRRSDGVDGTFCWSYTPVDEQRVLNATMKGARLCVEVHALDDRPDLADLARRTSAYVCAHQRDDGAWPYAVGDARGWSDGYHTGYILDALAAYARHTGDGQFEEARRRGYARFAEALFDGPRPKHRLDRVYPIDATACAQAVLTHCEFGNLQAAVDTAVWAIRNLQSADGAFAYQVHRRWTNRTTYARWSVAWMFCALSRLALELSAKRERVERDARLD